MSLFKIAWRSIQHRGLGSLLTILSMALGVMMVVAVLSIHGLVSQSFKSNNSFGYNVLVGARGGGLQLTLNTVYYLSQPVENIPYEYYLAFCDQETREQDLRNSFASQALDSELAAVETLAALGPGVGLLANVLTTDSLHTTHRTFVEDNMGIRQPGLYRTYTHVAVPLALGDYWEAGDDLNFRCVGTTPEFFTELVLDVDTEEKFSFSEGRCFRKFDEVNGLYECVVGAAVAKRAGVKLGQVLNPTHGDPNSQGAHLHAQGFTVVGIVDQTGTPNDRAVFLNLEGFYLMEDHAKPVEDDSILGTGTQDLASFDPFAEESALDEDSAVDQEDDQEEFEDEGNDRVQKLSTETKPSTDPALRKIPLPIEQREVTSILVRTSKDDEFNMLATFLPAQLNQGDLETTLDWSEFRPVKSQKASQAVNPVEQITSLFQVFVDPMRWLLLALTVLICIVSAISILVGIYNSMSQRQHEIAVMRALGANRFKVMSVMLIESILLACMGGIFGWIAGHGLNAAISPIVEARTGVGIGFFDLAPGVPLIAYILGDASSNLPSWLVQLPMSPEVLLIPGLILLAVIVGIYPAISAYRTDVASSLGK